MLLPVNEDSMYIKCRLKGQSINDVASMSMYSLCNLSAAYFVTLLNSKFMYDYLKTFINASVNLQINDFRALPIVIPSQIQMEQTMSLFRQAFELQKQGNFSSNSFIQANINAQVEKIYNILTS